MMRGPDQIDGGLLGFAVHPLLVGDSSPGSCWVNSLSMAMSSSSMDMLIPRAGPKRVVQVEAGGVPAVRLKPG
jgi:hypothetical protein